MQLGPYQKSIEVKYPACPFVCPRQRQTVHVRESISMGEWKKKTRIRFR